MAHTDSRTLAELRIENRALRRKVARLEKQLGRAATREAELDEVLEDLEEEAPPPKRVDTSKCPDCGSHSIGQLDTPSGKLINVCRICKRRF